MSDFFAFSSDEERDEISCVESDHEDGRVEDEDDEEDELELSSDEMIPMNDEIIPYQFDPMDSDYSPIPSPTQPVVGECHCGDNCGPPVDSYSVTCCNVAGCITTKPAFLKITDKEVLEMMIMKESVETQENLVVSNKTLRYMAYRAVFYHLKTKEKGVNWNNPSLKIEKGDRIPLHLCIVTKIRSMYPEIDSTQYTGFKRKLP